ncbi:MAG: MoaD/ThiS family protein [Deltaproteobacteria bacterium]|jgi:molybdopterin converting factor small subunit|nr:MoaD/ThiS family protein [Deltaproteobacteria bacterium]MBW2383951.1 MoaD/ThiS family protein [Deltaproteobacteria bacterium]
MAVRVQLTYDMGKELGESLIEIEGARFVKDVVRLTRERFASGSGSFDTLSRVTAIALNGVLINYRKGMKTPVADGDTVAFVKAAAGG